MIKAQELRIGNIISSQSNLHKQVTVLQLFSDSYQADFGNGNRGAMMYSTSDGIPLTSEWLERFGFQLITDGGDLIGNDRYWVGPALIGCLSLPNFQHSISGVTVRTVHQLQNLYFSLTGSELQLKDKKL